MKPSLLFLFFLLALTSSTKAQDSTSTRFDPAPRKWEIGINLFSVIEMPQEVATGLLVKRIIKIDKRTKALRLKVAPSITYGGSSQSNGYSYSPDIYVALGYEWQKNYGKFKPFYGGELFTSNSSVKAGAGNTALFKQNIFRLGGSAFLGAKYYLTKYLSLSIESHMKYTYSLVDLDQTNVSSTNYLRKLDLLPIYAFYLNYHL